jgi:hypothetical protein
MMDTTLKDWIDEGFTSEEIADFKANGFDVREAVVIRDHGLTPIEAQALLGDMDN